MTRAARSKRTGRLMLAALLGMSLWACFGSDETAQHDLTDCRRYCDMIATCNNPEDYGPDRLEACYDDCEDMLAPGSTLRPDGRLIDCADELDCTAFADCVAATIEDDRTDAVSD
jgi:hypothetical protein